MPASNQPPYPADQFAALERRISNLERKRPPTAPVVNPSLAFDIDTFPLTFDDGTYTYTLSAGVDIATLNPSVMILITLNATSAVVGKLQLNADGLSRMDVIGGLLFGIIGDLEFGVTGTCTLSSDGDMVIASNNDIGINPGTGKQFGVFGALDTQHSAPTTLADVIQLLADFGFWA